MDKKINKKKLFLQIFEKTGCNISATCKKVDIERKTYYNWMSKDEKFKEVVMNMQEALIDYAETKLMQKIKDDDTTSLIFFLKTKGRKRGYTEKPDVEVNIDSGKIDKIQVEFIE